MGCNQRRIHIHGPNILSADDFMSQPPRKIG